jgi:PEP-CTERM motif
MSAAKFARPFALGTMILAAVTTCPAATFGGVEFPQGLSSFADQVVSYDPVIKNGQPTAPNRNFADTVGAPNYNGLASRYASLGDGGSITLRFVDNRLTGSGSSAKDLWVFEVGPDVEDTFVEISQDGVTWHAVGKVFGSTGGIDIDAFGWGLADQFAFVRLTDDTLEGGQTGASVGADIDALGAISSVAVTPIPEPSTNALLLTGLAAMVLVARRRRAR